MIFNLTLSIQEMPTGRAGTRAGPIGPFVQPVAGYKNEYKNGPKAVD